LAQQNLGSAKKFGEALPPNALRDYRLVSNTRAACGPPGHFVWSARAFCAVRDAFWEFSCNQDLS